MSPRAFVLMPFSPDFDRVYRNIIQPALEGYDVFRADSRLDERGILEKIVTGIAEADLVVADITAANANVMYELGVAHALSKPTIMIAQSVTAVPFDVRAYPVHEYSYDAESAIAKHLSALAQRHAEGLLLFANPVSDFLPHAAVSPSVVPSDVSVVNKENVVEQINARTEEIKWATQATTVFSYDFQGLMANYAEGLKLAVATIPTGANAKPNDNPGIREAARLTRRFAAELESLLNRYHEIWERVGRAMLWLVSVEQRPYISIDQARTFVAMTKCWDEQLDNTLAELTELRRVSQSFPDWSGNLTHAFEVANVSISRHINEIMTAKSYAARIVAAVAS